MNEVFAIVECSWNKGIPFFSFGIKEAFATRMSTSCTVMFEKGNWFETDFEQGVDKFVVRAMEYEYPYPIPEWHIHVATAQVITRTGRRKEMLNFGIIAVFMRKHMITLQIEPYEYVPTALDDWFESASAYVRRIDPSPKFSKEIRADAFSIADISVHGFEIGMEMMGYVRENSRSLEPRVRN
ncbi:MAG TPA: hypothetical protein VMU25_02160 [Candidatus Paceibacterota bacterium]|nr:hypothetical protein [Candidatus Paceibacterota bacterium]